MCRSDWNPPGSTATFKAGALISGMSATRCNTRVAATCCSTLQHAAAHYSALLHTATHCNTLQHTATHCSTLQHIAGNHWAPALLSRLMLLFVVRLQHHALVSATPCIGVCNTMHWCLQHHALVSATPCIASATPCIASQYAY